MGGVGAAVGARQSGQRRTGHQRVMRDKHQRGSIAVQTCKELHQRRAGIGEFDRQLRCVGFHHLDAAAEAAGVTDEVLSSLDASEKALPWAQRAAYNLERMHTHGLRRAAEMEESAKTLLALGVPPVMTRGTVYRQRQAAQQNQASLDANGGGGN